MVRLQTGPVGGAAVLLSVDGAGGVLHPARSRAADAIIGL
jgi:hypothetical protein